MTPATRWLCHFYLAGECHLYLAPTSRAISFDVYDCGKRPHPRRSRRAARPEQRRLLPAEGNIFSSRFAPSKKLKINDLAAQLGVSPGAVREALSRPVPEGSYRETRRGSSSRLSTAMPPDWFDPPGHISTVTPKSDARPGVPSLFKVAVGGHIFHLLPEMLAAAPGYSGRGIEPVRMGHVAVLTPDAAMPIAASGARIV